MENNEYKDADLSTSGEENLENQEELDLFVGEESTEKEQALLKKIATLEAQKEHWRTKATAIKQEPNNKETKTDTTNEYLTKDEAILIAKGMELEDIEHAKLIQKGMGGTLKEALENPLFQAYTKQKEAEELRKKAQLGASGGSAGKFDEGFNKPGLTEAAHRALWEKIQK